jgi:AcrR family transcriptional regulator
MAAAAPHRADAQANRARLLAAARDVLAERGLGAEMKEIAERAGLGMGTIYRNFASKDDLVEALIRDRIAIAMAELERTREIADPVERLRAMLTVAWDRAEEDGPIISALHGATADPPVEGLTLLHEVFREGQALGRFRRDVDAVPFAMFVAAQFATYVDMRKRYAAEECARFLTDLLVHAVVTNEPSTRPVA